jgi:hypothetical protein
MLPPIAFDGEFGRVAIKVDDVAIERNLAPELRASCN